MFDTRSSASIASWRVSGVDLLQRIVDCPLIKVEDLRRDADHVGYSRQQAGSE